MKWVLVVLALYAGDHGGSYEVHTQEFRSERACKEAANGLLAIPRDWNSRPKIKAFCVQDGK
jgi:hypothetical protein